MFKQLILSVAAIATVGTTMAPVAAEAQRYDRGDRYERQYNQRAYNNRVYRDNGRNYRNNYRARQKCNDGDGGTIVGALAGGLLGHTVAGRGDRTLGAILGAVGGGVAGRAIDRSDRPGYCRR